MEQYDVCALGELLIDFTQAGTSSKGNPLMEANPGGAPCNVLACLTKMGHSAAFIGKVGKDGFGDQLESALKECGIATEGLLRDPVVHTTLAIVHTQPDGDRDFSFYRKPGADMMLCEEELKEEMIRNSRIFHFGSLSMTDEPCRTATRKAISLAKEAGILRSFDPNLREPLWDSLDLAKEQILYGLAHCDILKISDNEIQWLSGKSDYDDGIHWLREQFDIPLILLSMGKDGSRAYHNDLRVEVSAFHLDNTIETTGAGDTFLGGILHYVLNNGWKTYDELELRDMLTFANAAAALITTKSGALRVMPSLEEVEELLRRKE
ncbi:MAG: carbohydrate kinase [Oscillospiraceae bacterium]|nr:carbohydrate kinase [Oscillospiraceae bacterium]